MSREVLTLSHHPLTEEEKRELCSWNYEGVYSLYNLPSYEEMKAKQMGFLNPDLEQNYRAYYHKDLLVGFTNMLEKESEALIGIGVKPDLCGNGYGQSILAEAYAIAKKRFPHKPLCLEVRTWNQRAIRCYQKAGFQVEGRPYERETAIGSGTFCRMQKRAANVRPEEEAIE